MVLEMDNISLLPDKSLEGGIKLLNQLCLSTSVIHDGDVWQVFVSGKRALRTDSPEAVDAFLYGISLAYAVLPPEVYNHFWEWLEQNVS